ncbi:hypothetical protein [Pedobacter frigoris]|uniref:hypothetical protein n=1 Tax=Pedobacter frigoris TaxID=2571272 RepID=UPI00145CFD51|nr:hypothetical protein [Pedobacter frigoris]
MQGCKGDFWWYGDYEEVVHRLLLEAVQGIRSILFRISSKVPPASALQTYL